VTEELRQKLSDPERAEAERMATDWKATHDGALDWSALESQEPPPRDWAVKDWIGMGHTTLMSGPGGSGKTAVMQTVLSAISLGYEVIDEVPKPRRCLMWFGEDDKDEVWRRQVAICAWLGVKMSDLAGRFIAVCKDTEEMTLASDAGGRFEPTALLTQLREQIGDYKAEVFALDSVARCFGGKESDRHQVTQFIAWLNWAGSPTKAANVLLGHPAKATESEFSGSTAWEASVRARLYFGFKMPDQPEDPDNPPDNDLRYLAKRKSNYSVRDFRLVKWLNGAMIPQTPDPGMEVKGKPIGFLADEALYMVRKLAVIGIEASHATNSPNYLPRAAKAAGLLNGTLTEGDIKRGLAECLKTGRLTVGVVGTYGNRNPRKGLIEGQNASTK